MIPYSIIQGVMGALIGWYLANYLLGKTNHNENLYKKLNSN
jgi:hypothetical protein